VSERGARGERSRFFSHAKTACAVSNCCPLMEYENENEDENRQVFLRLDGLILKMHVRHYLKTFYIKHAV
jgi:hypothetical protein